MHWVPRPRHTWRWVGRLLPSLRGLRRAWNCATNTYGQRRQGLGTNGGRRVQACADAANPCETLLRYPREA